MKPVGVLLNPPGRPITLRDDYCSSISKTGYAWPAIDLIAQSGRLDPHFDLRVADASLSGWSAPRALDRLAGWSPHLILMLVGSMRRGEDLAFGAALFERTGARIAVSGDFARFEADELLATHPWIDGVLTDFTADGLARRAAGEDGPYAGYRVRDAAPEPLAKPGMFDYPLPRHDLFESLPYRMPFLGRGFASTLTAFGCPYPCTFCNSGAIGYARRSTEGFFAELEAIARAGVRSVYIKDFTFNAEPARTRALLEEWRTRRIPLRWTAFLRAERIDADTARLMRETGCRVAQVGIETANTSAAAMHKAGFDAAAVERGLEHLRAAGLPWGAHFVFGLPGDDAAGYRATMDWTRRAQPLYASYNVFTPRPGTRLSDNPRDTIANRPDDAESWARRAQRDFYGRPGSLLSMVRTARSAGSLRPLAGLLASGAAREILGS